MPHPQPQPAKLDAKPQPAEPDRHSAGAKRMDWRELQPAAQAGIRCDDPVFAAFLKEQRPEDWHESPDPVDCVYLICGINSRSQLGTIHRARVIWHQLDDQFQAWQRVGA